jgi:hypothetical protein
MVTHGQRDYRAMVHKHSTCSKRANPGVPSKMLYFPNDAPCQGKP